MTDSTAAFAKLVPGFDFLQGLVKNAGAAMPAAGQWVAPTLDPQELEKRIGELRTVQFWLEQNARLLGVTIQALEVQRMTLSALKTMNVSFVDLTESLKIRVPEPAPPPAPVAEPAPPEPEPAAATPSVPAGVPDPLKWWGALTQQFTELAASAMKDSASAAAHHLAGDMVKQGLDAASQTLKTAATPPASVAAAPAAKPARPRAAAKTGAAAQRSPRSKSRPA